MTSLPRGLLVGTSLALTIVWVLYLLGGSLVSAAVQSGVYVALLVLTWRSRRLKVLVVRTVQRWTVNPLMRLLLAMGVNPLGVAILETTGRRSGRPRRTPVGNGRDGADFWIIAEHGFRANYVRNILREPRVRVRLRIGWRYRWVDGYATVRPADDPLARQRRIVAWHPLRMLNAVNVRVLGADLLVVHVRLDLTGAGHADRSGTATSHTKPPLHTGDLPCEEAVSQVNRGKLPTP
jgi:deazaflavin-dependent oxidoreductase (nitroreductase family)